MSKTASGGDGEVAAARIGQAFAERYLIEAEIGQGGIGVVYRALDRKLGRPVALKLLRADAVGPSQVPRFEREAQALGALSHPNIVAVLAAGTSDGTPYLVMELLDGRSLAQARGAGPMPLARAAAIVRQLLSALAYVHEHGLVHRDLKPANVFLQPIPGGGEQVKLLDFGLAKFLDRQSGGGETTTLTRSGEVFGTPAYMPPEQWTGQPVDARADVYSAAVVCFELLAGRRPFLGEGQDLLRGQLIESVPLLHEACPGRVGRPELERFLQRALARQPHDRQRSAIELAAELQAVPEPWLYERAGVTPERESAARGARDALELATAPTMEQRAGALADAAARAGLHAEASAPAPPAPRPGGQRAPGGPLRRTAGAALELLRSLVLASAWTLSALSLFAIGAAATVIYVTRTPDHARERAALERALPPLRAAVERGAAAARTAVDDAVSGAAERVVAALPGQTPAAPGSEPQPAAAREPSRDPWRAPAPRELRRLRARIDAGERGADVLRALQRYEREHPADARAPLLRARVLVQRGAWSGAVEQYRRAFTRDPGSRGDPRMLQDLVRAAARPASAAAASELVRASYGREALDAIEGARAQARSPGERERLAELARAVSP